MDGREVILPNTQDILKLAHKNIKDLIQTQTYRIRWMALRKKRTKLRTNRLLQPLKLAGRGRGRGRIYAATKWGVKSPVQDVVEICKKLNTPRTITGEGEKNLE
jgi:hypothetical protein